MSGSGIGVRRAGAGKVIRVHFCVQPLSADGGPRSFRLEEGGTEKGVAKVEEKSGK